MVKTRLLLLVVHRGDFQQWDFVSMRGSRGLPAALLVGGPMVRADILFLTWS